MDRSGRSRLSPTRRIGLPSGRAPDTTPLPTVPPPPPARNDSARAAVAAFARLPAAPLGEPLCPLAHRDLLGPARRSDRISRFLELRLAPSRRDAPLSRLGGENERKRFVIAFSSCACSRPCSWRQPPPFPRNWIFPSFPPKTSRRASPSLARTEIYYSPSNR